MFSDSTEGTRAEDALREGQALLSEVLDTTPMLVACMDREFNFVFVNRAYASADARTPDFFPGKNHFALYPNAENEAFFRRVVETGEPCRVTAKRFEYKEHPERGVSYWDWSLVPIKDGDGRVERLVLTLFDATERRRSEEEALQARSDWERTFDSVPDLIAILDREHRVVRVNRAMAQRLGMTAEQCIGQACYHCVHDADAPPDECPHRRALADGHIHAIEVREDRLGGDFLVSCTPLFDEKGCLLGSVHIARDITDRKAAEARFLKQAALVARKRTLLVDWSARVVGQKRLTELLTTVSDAARALTDARLSMCGHGYAGGEFVLAMTSDSQPSHPGHAGTTIAIPNGNWCLDLLQDNPSVRLSEAEVRNRPNWWGLPEGHAPLRGLVAARLTDALGRPCGLVMASDKEASAEFTEEDESVLTQLATITSLALQHIEARDAANAANEAKSQFLTNMSHELRTPMNAIMGMTELVLAEKNLSPVARDCLETAKEAADALLELLNQMLDFSRIEAGRLELDSKPLDLRELLAKTLKPLAIRASQKGLELNCDVPPDLPRHVLGDALGLRQILTNLVGNAIKFTCKGDIVVRLRLVERTETEVCLEFSVSDTGIGISAEDQERVFAPFVQADASLTRQFGGTGLGLAISNSLVRRMRGRMWLESCSGAGSVFHFTIRLGLQPESDAGPETATESLAHLRDVSVLIVDSSETNRRELQLALAGWSMRPEAVSDVATALPKLHEALAAGRPFTVVIAAADLPGIDGFTLAQWIRSERKLAGSIILMISASRRSTETPRAAAFDGLRLDVPVSESALLAALTDAVAIASWGIRGIAMGKPPVRMSSAKKPLRVLLAEDNPSNQRFVAMALQNRGHDVEIAANGQLAVELLGRSHFDAVLMDIQMPLMDGFQATREIRRLGDSRKSRLPIVALTAHAMKGDEQRCLAAGMDAYLSKPVNVTELVETLERLCFPGMQSSQEPAE